MQIAKGGARIVDHLEKTLQGEYVAPRTELERSLAEIFAAVLHLPQVGVYDSFFQLGGNSLMANLAISRISRACSAELPRSLLFDYSSVAELATVIAQIQLEALASTEDIDKLIAEIEEKTDQA
jgi:acyl carrier protein